MPLATPATETDLADALRSAASRNRTIALYGNDSKRGMAGPAAPAHETISTAGLRRILQYEPHDLTISAEAGVSWCELTELLAQNRQMIPLDPPFASAATVGGAIASNCSGPRRRLYGAARDLVIGMRFATLEGKVIQSGGMVVKNVAGLDTGKLMIGSFGTLAAIASVNFKLIPIPEMERSFLLPFDSAADAIAARKTILAGAAQPAAIDLLNPPAGGTVGRAAWVLAIRAGGTQAAVERSEHEFARLADGVAFEDAEQTLLWRHIEDFTPRWMAAHPDGAAVRASCTLKDVAAVMASFGGPAVARAGSGVSYGYFDDFESAAQWLTSAIGRGWKAVIEFAPEDRKQGFDLWPAPGGDFEIMRRVKKLFDPGNLLNRGRLYNRI